jgi:hypothetical protein
MLTAASDQFLPFLLSPGSSGVRCSATINAIFWRRPLGLLLLVLDTVMLDTAIKLA